MQMAQTVESRRTGAEISLEAGCTINAWKNASAQVGTFDGWSVGYDVLQECCEMARLMLSTDSLRLLVDEVEHLLSLRTRW